MQLNKQGIIVDYSIVVNGSDRITEEEIQAVFDNLGS